MDRSSSSSSIEGTRAIQIVGDEKKTEKLEEKNSAKNTPSMVSKEEKKNGASKQDAYKNLKGSTQTKTLQDLNQVFNKDSLGSDQASTSSTSSISKRNSSATNIDSDRMGLSSTKPIVRSSSSTPNAISNPRKSLADSLWEQFPWQGHDDSSRFEMRPTMNFDDVCNWLASSPEGVKEAIFFSCGLGDAHAVALARSLKDNTTLKRLDLGMNSIGTKGAKALAVLLKDDTSLTNLDLWKNDIDDEGADALAEALKINKTLTTLVVSQNDINEDAANKLKDAAKLNKIKIE